jgi:hypothetical protein
VLNSGAGHSILQTIRLLCLYAAVAKTVENKVVVANYKMAFFEIGQLLYFLKSYYCLLNGKKQDLCPISL